MKFETLWNKIIKLDIFFLDEKGNDGQMTFKKPKKEDDVPKKKKSKMKKVKDTKLLSFGDQDEEEEE